MAEPTVTIRDLSGRLTLVEAAPETLVSEFCARLEEELEHELPPLHELSLVVGASQPARDTTIEVAGLTSRADVQVVAMPSVNKAVKVLRESFANCNSPLDRILPAVALLVEVEELDGEQCPLSWEIKEQLGTIQPMIELAEEAVSRIQPVHLKELVGYRTAHPGVQLAMEAAVVMLKPELERNCNWDVIKKVAKAPDFVEQLKTYKAVHQPMKERVRALVETRYMRQRHWSIDTFKKASMVAGPIALLVESQVKYASFLKAAELFVNKVIRRRGLEAEVGVTILPSKLDVLDVLRAAREEKLEALAEKKRQVEEARKMRAERASARERRNADHQGNGDLGDDVVLLMGELRADREDKHKVNAEKKLQVEELREMCADHASMRDRRSADRQGNGDLWKEVLSLINEIAPCPGVGESTAENNQPEWGKVADDVASREKPALLIVPAAAASRGATSTAVKCSLDVLGDQQVNNEL